MPPSRRSSSAVAVVGYLPLGTSSYKVTAEFENAGQLVKGNPVQIGGVAVDTVSDIEIAPNGHVLIAMTLKCPQTPLKTGTKAEIRQLSLSSIAGRYVELEQPSEPIAQRDESTIPEGGKIPISQTVTAVDLDQVFNVLDPVARVAIQDFIKASATQWKGKGAEAQPRPPVPQPVALDHAPALRRARLRQAAAAPLRHRQRQVHERGGERRQDLSGVVPNLNTTTRAIANEKASLREAIGRARTSARSSPSTPSRASRRRGRGFNGARSSTGSLSTAAPHWSTTRRSARAPATCARSSAGSRRRRPRSTTTRMRSGARSPTSTSPRTRWPERTRRRSRPSTVSARWGR